MNETQIDILSALSNGLTQSEVCHRLGMPSSTVSQITQYLIKHNFIRKIENIVYNIQYEAINEEPNGKYNGKIYTRFCKSCKQSFRTPIKKEKYCSSFCLAETHQGPKAGNWEGGDHFAPYCWRFNNSLKERVKAFFNYRCVLCGKDERENYDKKGYCYKLIVHHVKYNKQVCCDHRERLEDRQFVPLCLSCHSKTGRRKDREEWQEYFSTLIEKQYYGRCYFTKEEMRPQDQYYKF